MMTMDPSKGGRVLQGAGLASSHCHAQLSSDPAFAERAAKFSPFANGLNAQHSHSYEVGKNRERSGAGDGTGDGKLSSSNPSFSAFVGTIIENPHGLKAKAPGIMLGDIATLCDGQKLNSNEVGCDGHDLDVSTLPTVEAFEGATGIILSRNGYEEGDGHEDSSCSEQDGAVAKRKGPVEAKRKDSPDCKGLDSDELKAKRYKAGEAMREGDDVKCKAERSASEQSGDSSPRSLRVNSKPPEPPKQDYIHVRARRGQATDSHSLAERVRREKISERMKFLQDLVPGCSKVTGKAVMLDEIINYVQSLQRQIEFLSMKLAAVNPRLDVNLDNFLNKEVMQSRSPETILMGPEQSLGYGHVLADRQSPSQLSHPSSWDFRTLGMASEALLRRSSSSPISGHVTRMDDFCEPLSQLSSVWDGDLQSIVQMGFNQGRSGFFSQGLSGPGLIPTRHMKVEL